MFGQNVTDYYNENSYRIRSIKGLIDQVKEDHYYLNSLLKRIEEGETDVCLIEELRRVSSWLKQGLNTFEEVKKAGIEGVLCGEIEKIDHDMKSKETRLNHFLLSISFKRKTNL